MNKTRQIRELKTRKGSISLPAYLPVTTFGEKYPLDGLLRPYLPRLAPAIMVSLHYARQMKTPFPIPVFLDSGGFASLFEGASIHEENGLGILTYKSGEKCEVIHPYEVLEFQEKWAEVAFTLDFPVPPGMAAEEASRRQKLTISNAIWALNNRRRQDMLLYACIQAWDAESAGFCAAELAKWPFDGFAIGGLVPRSRDHDLVVSIVKTVKEVVGDRPLHVFGLGRPNLVKILFDHGVDSVDSSSYVKLAADGKLWSDAEFQHPDPSPTERLQLALCNLAMATQQTMPLALSPLIFSTLRKFRSVSINAPGSSGFGPER